MSPKLPKLQNAELEEAAGHLSPRERIEMAEKLEWWARALRTSAHAAPKPRRPKKLRELTRTALWRN